MRRRYSAAALAIAAALLMTACAAPSVADRAPPLAQHPGCATAEENRRWLGEALAGWRTVLRDFLEAPEAPLPEIVAYDARCSYTLAASPGARPRWSVAEHRGEIPLPNGATVPPAPGAFNAVTPAGRNFVAVALPSIWRPFAPPSEIPLDWFLEGVLLHELAHAFQSQVTPRISFPSLHRRMSLPPDVSDDSVQETFAGNADFVRDYEAERDLLFRAASAPDFAQARTLACEALDRLRDRRARYFTGASAHWSEVDELSLTTEGLGQWVAYKWLTEGRGLAPSLVLSKLRGRFWSQDQGLAIFLAIDRLVPDWQSRLFSRSPATAEPLLALACRR